MEKIRRIILFLLLASLYISTANAGFSDAKQVLPTNVSGLTFWWKADALSLSDGQAVGTWIDSSGNGNDGIQITVDKKPTYRNLSNGIKTVSFDGTNDVIRLNGIGIKYIMIVANESETGATFSHYYGLFQFWDSGNSETGGFVGTTGYDRYYLATNTDETKVYLNQSRLSCPYDGGWGGFMCAVGTPLKRIKSWRFEEKTISGDNFTIGGRENPVYSPFGGYIYEVVGFNRILSEHEARNIESYFAHKYNFTINATPVISSVTIPNEPQNGIGLNPIVNVSSGYNDPYAYNYQWYENGNIMNNRTERNLTVNYMTAGRSYKVHVEPAGGGAGVFSNSITSQWTIINVANSINNGYFDMNLSGWTSNTNGNNVVWEGGEMRLRATAYAPYAWTIFTVRNNTLSYYALFDTGASNSLTVRLMSIDDTITYYSFTTISPIAETVYINLPDYGIFTDDIIKLRFDVAFGGGSIFYIDNVENTYPFGGIIPTTFTATGNVKFQDIDGSLHNLQNATVKLNESIYTVTDAFGDYSIALLKNQTNTLTASYNDAMNIATGAVSEGSPTHDFTLLYSKGSLTTPVLDGGKIKTTYSNNIASVNLWEFPNFVWGAVRYDKFINTSNDKWYYYSAQYLGNSQFGLNVEYGKGGYTVYFTSSDFYNYPTNGWNPEVSAYRFFNSTSYYYDETNEVLKGTASNKTQSVRESDLKDNAEMVIPFFMFIILLLAFASKIKERRR